MGIDVLTNRYENSRIGVNAKETVLNAKSVSIPTFGKLFARTVDGDLYAQPLIVSDLTIGGMKRDVVFLATSRNWVYAHDAEHPEEVLPLWSRNLGMPVPRDDIFPGYLNFAGEIGITSTPVIERDGKEGGTLYVVVKTRTVEDGNKSLRYEIHALDILTGRNRAIPRKPVVIAASVRNAKGGVVKFDARWHLNRAGLLLLKGVLYLAFGSHGDVGEFYGWIMAYDAHTLAQLAVCNTAPDWGQGGIWQSGTGLAGDADGFVYAVVGNGEAPSSNLKKNPPVREPAAIRKPVYGNAILKLELVRRKRGAALKIVDWFTASDTMLLNETDSDFIGGPVLFEAPAVAGSSGQFVLGGGKDGKFYLGDRTHLGKFMPGSNTAILQAEPLCAFHIHGAPVVWKKSDSGIVAYVWSEKDFLQAFQFTGKKFDSRPLSTSVYGLPQDELRMPGGILSVSSNGTQDGSGIVWASHPTDDDGMNKTVKGTLRAYDARDLNNELWNSDMDAEGSDRVGSLAKFCPPVVANGKVYMATFSRELVVYGLFSEIGKPPRSNYAGIFELRGVGPGIQQSGSYGCSRYDLRITGQGIGGKQDNFLFASVDRDSDNEPEIAISARVDGINASQYPDARAGVMIRKFDQTSDPGKHRFAAMVVTNQNKVLFVHRDAEGAVTGQDGPIGVTVPCFIRLTGRKDGGIPGVIGFTGEVSQDGTAWKTVSAVTKFQIDGRLMAGLAVTAQTGPVADTSFFQAHACFSKVAVVPALSDVTVD
ncbi:MAG: hypothetical protein ACREDT_09020 [Methylocella sp.]